MCRRKACAISCSTLPSTTTRRDERHCIGSSRTRSVKQKKENDPTVERAKIVKGGSMMQSVGLIGLGNAGRPMAERILSKGYALSVFDIDNAKVQAAVERGALATNSAAAAACEITITLLPSSVEVRHAIFGAGGALGNLKAGMTLVELSGTDADCA